MINQSKCSRYPGASYALLVLSILLALGCTSTDGQQSKSTHSTDRIIIAHGIIENLTSDVLYDVEVMHMPTRAIATFSPVLPKQKAELGFQPTELMANEAQLTWLQKGETKRIQLRLPQVVDSTNKSPMTLIYSILPEGQVTAHLR